MEDQNRFNLCEIIPEKFAQALLKALLFGWKLKAMRIRYESGFTAYEAQLEDR